MTIAADLLQHHIHTLVADNGQWQTLIADDLVWELPYAPSIGHPARLSGREEVVGFVTWFLGAVEHFRFFDLTVYACADPDLAVAEVKAEARIKPTGRPLSPGVCGVPAGSRWQDRVPPRIFQSRAGGPGDGRAHS